MRRFISVKKNHPNLFPIGKGSNDRHLIRVGLQHFLKKISHVDGLRAGKPEAYPLNKIPGYIFLLRIDITNGYGNVSVPLLRTLKDGAYFVNILSE